MNIGPTKEQMSAISMSQSMLWLLGQQDFTRSDPSGVSPRRRARTNGTLPSHSELPSTSHKLIRLRRLRVHATQEWHDLYQRETNDELQKFLDHYTKDIDNGWEETPKVRVSIYQYNKVRLPRCVVVKLP